MVVPHRLKKKYLICVYMRNTKFEKRALRVTSIDIHENTLALKHRLFSREGSLVRAQFNTFILHIRKQTQRSQSQEHRQIRTATHRLLLQKTCAASAFTNVRRNCLMQMRVGVFFVLFFDGLNTIAFGFLASWVPLSQDPQLPPSLQFFLLHSKLDSTVSSISAPPTPAGQSPLCPEPCPSHSPLAKS